MEALLLLHPIHTCKKSVHFADSVSIGVTTVFDSFFAQPYPTCSELLGKDNKLAAMVRVVVGVMTEMLRHGNRLNNMLVGTLAGLAASQPFLLVSGGASLKC